MENASRALLIAFGVILSVLLLAGLMNVKDNIASAQEAKNLAKLIKENSEFNAKYEAYNKKFMYGTDVISALGLAYDNNQKEENNDLVVSINIKLLDRHENGDDILRRRYKYVYNTSTRTYDKTKDNSQAVIIAAGSELKYTYDADNGGHRFFITNKTAVESKQCFEELIKRSSGPEYKKESDLEYSISYGITTDFKRRTFLCEEVKYSTTTGKVNEMNFKEISIGDYEF